MFRHSIERMDPAHYLSSSYYEHWLTGVATLAVEAGVVTSATSSSAARAVASRCRVPTVDGCPTTEADAPSRGSRSATDVRVREWHPPGHTRAPRYVQGKRGEIVRVDGAHNVAGHRGARRRIVCSTRRTRCASRRASCGARAAPTAKSMHVDLWERYLEDGPA